MVSFAMELEKEFTFRNTSLPQRCYNTFVGMRNEKKFCDTELNVGAQRFSAHRVILAGAIPLFRETFSNVDEIPIPNIDSTVFECLLNYAYSCELKITMDNVRGLLSGSCALQMNDVQDACCDFLSLRLQPQNVLSFRDLANDLNLPKLKECVELYAKENFEEVSGTEEFLNCPFEYVRELIAQDDLNVVSEEKVLDSVLRWIKASLGDRTNQLPELLTQVRMVLLEPLYLTELIEKEDLIRKSYICRDLVDEARSYNLFVERRSEHCRFVAKPRELMKITKRTQEMDTKLYCLKAELKYAVREIDLINQTWQPEDTQEYRINSGSITQLNRKMYFFHDTYSLEYDPGIDKYQLLRPFNMSRNFTAAVSFRNKIFVCGGRIGRLVASNAVECYDPQKNELKQVNSLQSARWCLNAVSMGNYIYALGGTDIDNIYDIVEKYSFDLDKWEYVSPMLNPKFSASAAVLNDKIYVCGGDKGISKNQCMRTAEMYDPVTNKWNYISSMTTARKELTLLVFSGKLYAIGGYNNDKKPVKSFEVYDLLSDKWEYDPNVDGSDEVSAVIVL